MNLWSMKGRILVGVGTFVGIISAFYFLVYLPQIQHRKSLTDEIAQQKMRVTKLQQKAQELDELQQEHQEMLEDLSFLEEKIGQNQASFLYNLGERGKVYGIEYMSIIPASTVEENYYYRTPLKIHLYGKYHHLGMLLSDMARQEEMGSFSVESLSLRTLSNSNNDHSIEANLTLSVYQYKGISDNSSLQTEEANSSYEVSSTVESTRRVR